MAWFRVDDKLWGHPKWLATPARARALWVTAGSWCADQLTDGRVPSHVLPVLGGSTRDAVELVARGLWKPSEDGWEFHDWIDFQPSREQVQSERAAAKERQRRAREKARESRQQSRGESRRDEGVSHGPPDPTRPDPTRSSFGTTPSANAEGVAASRGARIPDDFTVTDEMRSWAKSKGFDHLDLDAITEEFFDYWHAVPGAKGVKLDWTGTWRNWIRRKAEDAKVRPIKPDRSTAPDGSYIPEAWR